MLDDLRRHERSETRSLADTKKRKKLKQKSETSPPIDVATDEANRTQWTVKGIDKDTLELSRKAARKRGMKFGAWVNQVLRAAASEDGTDYSGASRELLSKINEIEFKLEQSVGRIIEQSSGIGHDVRVLQLLMPKAASK